MYLSSFLRGRKGRGTAPFPCNPSPKTTATPRKLGRLHRRLDRPAATGPCRSVQLESNSAQAAGSGNAARVEKPRWANIFSTFRLSMPDNGQFLYRPTHSPDLSADGTFFPVPHTSSPLVRFS